MCQREDIGKAKRHCAALGVDVVHDVAVAREESGDFDGAFGERVLADLVAELGGKAKER